MKKMIFLTKADYIDPPSQIEDWNKSQLKHGSIENVEWTNDVILYEGKIVRNRYGELDMNFVELCKKLQTDDFHHIQNLIS